MKNSKLNEAIKNVLSSGVVSEDFDDKEKKALEQLHDAIVELNDKAFDCAKRINFWAVHVDQAASKAPSFFKNGVEHQTALMRQAADDVIKSVKKLQKTKMEIRKHI